MLWIAESRLIDSRDVSLRQTRKSAIIRWRFVWDLSQPNSCAFCLLKSDLFWLSTFLTCCDLVSTHSPYRTKKQWINKTDEIFTCLIIETLDHSLWLWKLLIFTEDKKKITWLRSLCQFTNNGFEAVIKVENTTFDHKHSNFNTVDNKQTWSTSTIRIRMRPMVFNLNSGAKLKWNISEAWETSFRYNLLTKH